MVGLAVLASSALVMASQTVDAAAGVDDYPTRLKQAPKDHLVDPWSFYNRECTSFVAWRINQGGIAFDDYYLGAHWGDASHWKSAATASGVTVDDQPRRGAIAWWAAGSPGSSPGHVAWVEDVDATSITIEEYNYLVTGGYDYRVIDESSSLWPTDFIHVGDLSIHNTEPPTVVGDAQVGESLHAQRGSWSAGGATFTYQWFANGVAIDGKTRNTLRVTAPLLHARIRVGVTATKPGVPPSTASSSITDRVAPGILEAVDDPSIAGAAKVGSTLRAAQGTWTPKGAHTFQWLANGKAISGATARRYTPAAAQLGKTITVRVRTTHDGYRPAAEVSAATPAVARGSFVNSSPPAIGGTPQVGEPLTASAGEWSPSPHYTYAWYADGVAIPHATSATYTPRAAVVRQQLTVVVTARQAGYNTESATSAVSDSVAPGAFLNTRAPSVTGKAQVGVALTADAGSWSPKARIHYQWYADGSPVPGATKATFTPRPGEVGMDVAVQITALRHGYLSAVILSDATAKVAIGEIQNLQPPTVAGKPFVGRTLTASAGSWSVSPSQVSYQWLSGGTPIEGATESTYVVADADGGRLITVRVSVAADGYRTDRARSSGVVGLFGHASFARQPRIKGQAQVGETLTAVAGAVTPHDVRLTYQWYRDGSAIAGADRAEYDVVRHDVDSHLMVRVTISARGWAPTTRRSHRTSAVRDAA